MIPASTGPAVRWSDMPDDDCVAALIFLYQVHSFAEQCKGADMRVVGFKKADVEIMTTIAERILMGTPITERQLYMMKYTLNGYAKQLKGVKLAEYATPFKLIRFETSAPKTDWKRCSLIADDTLKLEFSYDSSLIAKIKTLSGRKFHNYNTEKFWTVPASKANLRMLKAMGFELPEQFLSVLQKPDKTFDYSGMLLPLRPYQIQGANRLAGELKMSGLLADEMGLGKTAQALAALWARRDTAFPALVVCPGSLKLNWAREAEKFLPEITVRVLNGRPNRTKYNCREQYEITVINYDILNDFGEPGSYSYRAGWAELLKNTGFKTVIFDECHKIKNPKAKRTQAIKEMCKGIKNRLALSGTPIESRPMEFFTTLSLVAPKLFPNYWQFGVRYCGSVTDSFGTKFNGASNIEELNSILTENCMIRRKKADVLKDLPPKQRQVIPVEIDMRAYREAENSLTTFLQKTQGVITPQDKIGVLAQIECCKQAAVQGKMRVAIEFIDNYLESGRKLVVFATHTFVLDKLQKNFKGITARVDGKVTGAKRQAEVDRFQNDPKCKLFIGNIKAAGVGLTLTAASDTLTLELGWTPGEHTQAEDRVHRIGQTADSVMAYYMVAQDTIEQKIMQILDDKMGVLSRVLDGEEVQKGTLLTELLNQYGVKDSAEKPTPKRRSKPGAKRCRT